MKKSLQVLIAWHYNRFYSIPESILKFSNSSEVNRIWNVRHNSEKGGYIIKTSRMWEENVTKLLLELVWYLGVHFKSSDGSKLLPRKFFFFFSHLYWSIIASQYCVTFCCTPKWISHMHTYVPISPPSRLPPILPIPPL